MIRRYLLSFYECQLHNLFDIVLVGLALRSYRLIYETCLFYEETLGLRHNTKPKMRSDWCLE